jgi:hypothetical protein
MSGERRAVGTLGGPYGAILMFFVFSHQIRVISFAGGLFWWLAEVFRLLIFVTFLDIYNAAKALERQLLTKSKFGQINRNPTVK